MKPRIVAKLLFLIIAGSAFGLHIHSNHLLWRSRGLTAFLTHETEYFNKYTANSSSRIHDAVLFSLVALLIASFYEGTAFLVSRLFTRKAPAQSVAK